MRNIAIIDKSFDSNVTSACELYIQYGSRSCTLAVFDAGTRQYMAFKNIWFDSAVAADDQADHIRGLLHGEQYLIRQFRSARFLYLSPRSVLIPSTLFQKEKPEIFCTWSFPVKSTDRILFRKIPEIDAFTVYPIRQDIFNQVELMLPEVSIFHQSSPFISDAVADTDMQQAGSAVLANIQPDFIDLLVISHGHLLLYNSYTVHTAEEIAYFTLYLYDQFGLSRDDTPLLISGFPELYPGTVELLSGYVKSQVNRDFPKSFLFSPVFDCLERHHFSNLFNLARCE